MKVRNVYRKKFLSYDLEWRQVQRMNDVDDIAVDFDGPIPPNSWGDFRDRRDDEDLQRDSDSMDFDHDYDGDDGECER